MKEWWRSNQPRGVSSARHIFLTAYTAWCISDLRPCAPNMLAHAVLKFSWQLTLLNTSRLFACDWHGAKESWWWLWRKKMQSFCCKNFMHSFVWFQEYAELHTSNLFSSQWFSRNHMFAYMSILKQWHQHTLERKIFLRKQRTRSSSLIKSMQISSSLLQPKRSERALSD